MDHHRQLRAGETLHVTVLPEREAGSPGTVAKHSGERVELLVDEPARAGAAVKLEGDDTLFLGEVCSCRPLGASFAVIVELQHALYDTQALARFARRILDEDERR